MEIKKFKLIRESLGWSQNDLSKRLGVCLVTVNRYEKGKSPIPPLVREKMLDFEKIAEKLQPIS